MGAEKLDVAVYTIRGLLDLAEMAHAEGDTATQSWAESKAAQMRAAFGPAWWLNRLGTPSYADSLADPTVSPFDPTATLGPVENTQVFQRHWIGVTPMEAELWDGDHAAPGVSVADHANPALGLRDEPRFGRKRPIPYGHARLRYVDAGTSGGTQTLLVSTDSADN